MSKIYKILIPALLLITLSFQSYAADTKTSGNSNHLTEDHHQLKIMLNDSVDAINKKDFARLIDFLDEDAVVIYQNAEIVRGHDEINKNLDKYIRSDNSILVGHTTEAQESAPAIINGNNALGFGKVTDTFIFRGGKEVKLTSSWMSNLRKTDGKWLITSLQFSSNVFENPLMPSVLTISLIVGSIGIILGFVISWVFRKK